MTDKETPRLSITIKDFDDPVFGTFLTDFENFIHNDLYIDTHTEFETYDNGGGDEKAVAYDYTVLDESDGAFVTIAFTGDMADIALEDITKTIKINVQDTREVHGLELKIRFWGANLFDKVFRCYVSWVDPNYIAYVEDENRIVSLTPLEGLPLLIGNLKFESSREILTKRLQRS